MKKDTEDIIIEIMDRVIDALAITVVPLYPILIALFFLPLRDLINPNIWNIAFVITVLGFNIAVIVRVLYWTTGYLESLREQGSIVIKTAPTSVLIEALIQIKKIEAVGICLPLVLAIAMDTALIMNYPLSSLQSLMIFGAFAVGFSCSIFIADIDRYNQAVKEGRDRN